MNETRLNSRISPRAPTGDAASRGAGTWGGHLLPPKGGTPLGQADSGPWGGNLESEGSRSHTPGAS